MARPLRIEFAGAVYHLMARGNAGDDVFRDDEDRQQFLDILARTCAEEGWRVLCFCLMDNHVHLVVITDRATLARGMRQLIGVYSQRFNRRHGRHGHLFQGRYKSLLVETSAYLTQLCAYVLRNPVAAGLVPTPGAWPRSSYRWNSGGRRADWFDPLPLWGELGARAETASRLLAALTAKPREAPDVRGQLCYGGDQFAAGLAQRVKQLSPEHSRQQKAALSPAIAWYVAHYPDGDEAMARACLEGFHSRTAVARHYNVYPSTVSRAVQRFRAQNKT